MLHLIGNASGGLPAGWSNRDIDSPEVDGSASYDNTTDRWTLQGDGHDIWDNSDNFHYAYTPLSGDGMITARVIVIDGPGMHGWRKAGVMIRESLTGPSKHAMTVVTGGEGGSAAFQWRASTWGSSSSAHDPSPGVSPPYWVRIMREGNRFTGYLSSNGNEWRQQGGTVTIDMARDVYIGLCVTSHISGVMSRFETEILTQPENLAFLMNLPGMWVDTIHKGRLPKQIILDMDSSVSPTYGNQEGSAYNGFFECTCYHPLFCFNQFGDLEGALLRNGNVHSADDWQSLLEPAVNHYRGYDILRFFRGDAAFANPEIYRYLEAEGYFYAIRLKGNQVLYNKIKHLLTRPVGRPPKKPIVLYHSFRNQTASWDIPRRVVAKVEWHADELFPRVGFIVTNLRWKSSNVVRFYNKRGTAEQWIKEGKYALNWTRLSCHDFVDNQVRLQLFALAYNLGNFLRRLVLPKPVKKWSLRTLREKLIKMGAKVISHSRYVIFQMAEVAVPRALFREILNRIRQLRSLAIPAGPG